jgi:N-glycosylase/DNA lyase
MTSLLSSTTMPVNHFYLKDTFESGQPLTFHAQYDQFSDTLTYMSGMNIINVRFSGTRAVGSLTVVGRDIRFASAEVHSRFRLADDMEHCYDEIGTDSFMKSAIEKYSGMRLTLNDPWETTLCFIISQYNNMKRIRGIVRNLINRYGTAIKDNDDKMVAKSFPRSADLMSASEKDLMECGAGFRAKYIKEAAEYCTENMDLNKLGNKKYDALKEELLAITGVGDKVADCIALMGYGKLEAFPIDVWVERTLEKAYFKGKKKTIKELHKFAAKKWGAYAGYAQQYIFWHGMHLIPESEVEELRPQPEDKPAKPAKKR